MDDVFAQPGKSHFFKFFFYLYYIVGYFLKKFFFVKLGIGVPGVSSTDTNHGLFIGGHPRPDRLTGKQSTSDYSGCIKNIVIEGIELDVKPNMLKGDILSHVCPTI